MLNAVFESFARGRLKESKQRISTHSLNRQVVAFYKRISNREARYGVDGFLKLMRQVMSKGEKGTDFALKRNRTRF